MTRIPLLTHASPREPEHNDVLVVPVVVPIVPVAGMASKLLLHLHPSAQMRLAERRDPAEPPAQLPPGMVRWILPRSTARAMVVKPGATDGTITRRCSPCSCQLAFTDPLPSNLRARRACERQVPNDNRPVDTLWGGGEPVECWARYAFELCRPTSTASRIHDPRRSNVTAV